MRVASSPADQTQPTSKAFTALSTPDKFKRLWPTFTPIEASAMDGFLVELWFKKLRTRKRQARARLKVR